ncbi:hypothetical protein MCOR03_000821 [Pyricularia oryzae]|uniref:FAD-binding domain-containing protein n=1 Tax=Pyricularia grisea TaxID=148305 RepID=A0ABQ8NUG3_PYRGI|nr:hypothetical protein MCOR33_003143 [Pyricularia grisea]KAI6333870.1 hypothetical protein MCOR30_004153 [Pyricularia oryzae]KAI6534767.1 hypothetical protein MCOR05_006230 [Pyricularia oryzae]KAI6562731.1 hypothetical protein MCOR04_009297 [Pyricularia oryzae]KAI6567816.1 hypothetical protein MCOR03_000821 [Pyricularia oryzae]
MVLKVIVVGGGIAGLASTTALRRAGHNVTILERSQRFDNEVGAAIHVPPNSTRPLIAWGFDVVRARLVRFKHNLFADGKTLEVQWLAEKDTKLIDDVYGGPWMAAHRVDLHEELRRLAFAEPAAVDDAWGTVEVRLGAEVVAYSPETPSVTLADGQVVSGDLVVVANGIHSGAPAAVTGKTVTPKAVGAYNFCYRFLIPTEVLNSDPETKDWDKERGDGAMNSFVVGDKRLVTYTCRNNEVHNFVGLFNDPSAGSGQREDWHASADRSKVLETFSEFHPQLRTVISKATEYKQWPLLYRDPLPTWIKGGMVIVGDASHPMLPFQGQGGAQAVEDGVALGISMAGATPETVGERLVAFDSVRRNRASALQILSNVGQDEALKVRAEAAKFVPIETVPKGPDEFYAFSFAYNVVKDMVSTMRKNIDPQFELPKGFFIKEPVVPGQ